MGAWIETLTERETRFTKPSHPMWVRGLKRNSDPKVLGKEGSHPMWVRGLKLLFWSRLLVA